MCPGMWALGLALACLVAARGAPVGAATRDISVGPAPMVQGKTLYANSWAVVIGINRYRHSGIARLGAAVGDARRMREVLLQLGFPDKQILVLTDEQATKAAIETLLGERLRRLAKTQDRVVIFFAGHGTTEKLRGDIEEGYLLPVDADPENLFTTAISMTTLKQIAARQQAKHVLFAVDACYSGYAIYTTRGITNPALVEELTRKPAIQILTAGRGGDLAQERDGQGLFTKSLIAGLQGQADQRGWGWVSLNQLGEYVQARVFAESDKKQLPQFGNLDGEGQFVFVLPRGSRVTGQGSGERPPEAQAPQGPSQPSQPLPPVVSIPPPASPLTGDLDLTSDPPGASVKLDGREVGKTPLTLERLPVGEHTLELDKDGIYAGRKQVTIAVNTLDKLSLRLDRLKGKLTVFSEPRDASVALDGQTVGTTPLSLDTDAGPHTLRLTKEGYKPHEEPLTVPANRETRTRIALKSTRGTLEVQTKPSGATVEIAGTRPGQTPLSLLLEEGSYDLQIRLPKFRGETRRVEIAAERTTRVTLDLTPGLGAGDVDRRGKDNAEMVYIPAGTFTMGDTHGDGYSDEKPTHQITVADFWLDRTEVTNAQFARFVQVSGYRPQGEWQREATGKDQHPVVNITWPDALVYCRWADKRLPTEAEWEYAARGTDGRKYPWGNTWEESSARFTGNRGNQTTAPVGSYPSGASPFGVLDLAGKVSEWTSSLYKPYPYAATDGREDPAASGSRVIRGGSWDFVPRDLRSASRDRGGPSYRGGFIGFRCAQGVQ